MGVAKKVEQRLEGLVEGFFARVFRSGLQPVEVGRRIIREMGENKTVSVNRVYVPNEFHVEMGSEDYERFSQMEDGLRKEFSEIVIQAAKENRWNLMGMPRFSFDLDDDVGKGEFRVDAALAADPDRQAPEVATHDPDRADPGATRAISTTTAERLGLPSARARLVVLDASGAPRDHISISDGPVTIGRMSTNDIVLSDPNVSRHHAELRREGDAWVLVDLGSTNGSLVNDKPTRSHELSHGDRLRFGTSELIFDGMHAD